MLVFTRKRQEAIVIGDGIEIRVLRIGKEGVQIGVSRTAQRVGPPPGNLRSDPRRERAGCCAPRGAGDLADHVRRAVRGVPGVHPDLR